MLFDNNSYINMLSNTTAKWKKSGNEKLKIFNKDFQILRVSFKNLDPVTTQLSVSTEESAGFRPEYSMNSNRLSICKKCLLFSLKPVWLPNFKFISMWD